MIDFVVVSADLRQPDRPGKPKPAVRVNWEHLVEAPVHGVFNSHLRKNFSCILGEVGDMESEWVMFKASIVEVAARSCGQKAVGACCGGNLRTCWWTLAVKEAIRLKKEVFRAWLAQGSPETADGTGRPDGLRLQWSLKQKPGCERSSGRALDIFGLTWLTLLHGGHLWGQYLWSGRPAWWSPFLRKGTGGCAPIIRESHCSASPGKFIPGCWKGGSGRLSNLSFSRNDVDSVLAVEQWTSSLPLHDCWGGGMKVCPSSLHVLCGLGEGL